MKIHFNLLKVALLMLLSFATVNSSFGQCGFNTDRRSLSFSADVGKTQTEELALANTSNQMMTLTFAIQESTDGGVNWNSNPTWFTIDKSQAQLNGDSLLVNVTFHSLAAS